MLPPDPIDPIYADFLRTRWPSRARKLAGHALAGSFVFVALDWIFTRGNPSPPALSTIAALRLPWTAIPIAGWLLQRRAPGWRHLPSAVVGLSVVWAWAATCGYFAIGLGGSVLQAITLFACLVTTAALMPLSGGGRGRVFALMALGYVAYDLFRSPPGSLAARVADDAAVLAFAYIQTFVFQTFEASRQKSVLLRHRLEQAVTELEASQRRAAGAVAEVGRLAAEVAHDVNNPLAAVKVNVRWLATEGAGAAHAEEQAEVVVESLQAIDRIAAIVQDLGRRATEQQASVQPAPAAGRAAPPR